MNTKICFKCQQDLPLSSFNKNSSKKDGLAHECRECKKLYQRKFYLDNKQDHILKANSRKQELRRKLKELKSTLKCNRPRSGQADVRPLVQGRCADLAGKQGTTSRQ